MAKLSLWSLLGLVVFALAGCASTQHHQTQQATHSSEAMGKGHSVQSMQKGSQAATLAKGK